MMEGHIGSEYSNVLLNISLCILDSLLKFSTELVSTLNSPNVYEPTFFFSSLNNNIIFTIMVWTFLFSVCNRIFSYGDLISGFNTHFNIIPFEPFEK